MTSKKTERRVEREQQELERDAFGNVWNKGGMKDTPAVSMAEQDISSVIKPSIHPSNRSV